MGRLVGLQSKNHEVLLDWFKHILFQRRICCQEVEGLRVAFRIKFTNICIDYVAELYVFTEYNIYLVTY